MADFLASGRRVDVAEERLRHQPSRASATHARLKHPSRTDVIGHRLAATRCIHVRPTRLKASTTGASMLIWFDGTMPVSTADTAM